MKIKFCIECAAPLHQENQTKYTCPNGHIFWNNAKTTVGVVLLKNGQFLASERAMEPQKGKYDFPGGFVDFGESTYDAARRELDEELGIRVEQLEVIDTANQIYIENVSTCDTMFVCTKWQGTPEPKDEVASLAWKPIDFIDSEEFAWSYPDLAAKLKTYANRQN